MKTPSEKLMAAATDSQLQLRNDTMDSHLKDSQPTIWPDWVATEGSPFPLGVSLLNGGDAINFALYSKNAKQVELLLYRAPMFETPAATIKLNHLKNKSGPIWHCRVSKTDAEGATHYGYRVDGPIHAKENGWSGFDSEKVLLDPYARTVFVPPEFDRELAMQPGSNAGKSLLGVIEPVHMPFEWGDDPRRRHGTDLVIYEMHVKGFTEHPNSGVEPKKRGTFEGVVEKIPYLLDLGITAIELMPVFQFDPQEGNYWGYMPLNFFSAHADYSTEHTQCQRNEFREMVKALHAVGIEVFLDVVYNHTGEGNQLGPTYSFRGIDDSTYYMQSADARSPYLDFSGCGNTLDTEDRSVRQLIVDSLRYWDREMHVDGFRFDLASVFARRSDGSLDLDEPPLFGQITADPELSSVRLIAEPWDASDGFLLGRKFPGQMWLQWNSKYRETLQRFVRGDKGMVGELMTRLYGSSDLFPDDAYHACRPFQSVNYIVSHDGFSMYDLVSYSRKYNLANGHSDTDGTSDSSWNCGWEGDIDVPPEVLRLRKQQVKNFFCLLMVSAGTPMFRMGDEFLQTQGGNNNPYNQDNETSWLNWERKDQHADIHRFFRSMIHFRKSHPSLGRSRFWREDVVWHGVTSEPDLSPESRSLAFYLSGESQNDDDIYVMINSHSENLRFGIFQGQPEQWRQVVNTAADSPEDFTEHGSDIDASLIDVAAHAVVVLVRDAG